MASITVVTAPRGGATIISIGYERRSIDDLIAALRQHKVSMLVDVRMNAISRKKGFSKTALTNALTEAGIGYLHKRDLGNPKENRDPFRKGLKSARDHYLRHLRNSATDAFHDLTQLARTTQIALLCYERDHDQCHRSCIIETVQEEHPGLSFLAI